MPTPAKTGREQLIAVALELLEEGGPDAVTMRAVADRVGVRPPSLYKHVRDRRELLAEVVAATVDELNDRSQATRDPDPRRSVAQQVRALRAFAHERPHGYRLIFGTAAGVPRPTPADLDRSLRPLLDATTELVGAEHALDAARFLTAWSNGYITMELDDQLQMGGDLDAAWEWGVEHAIAAVSGPVV